MKKQRITGLVRIDLIKEYMKTNKLSQKRFAEMCNLNVWNLRHVLSDDCHFNAIYLFKIAKVMKVNVCDLLKTK